MKKIVQILAGALRLIDPPFAPDREPSPNDFLSTPGKITADPVGLAAAVDWYEENHSSGVDESAEIVEEGEHFEDTGIPLVVTLRDLLAWEPSLDPEHLKIRRGWETEPQHPCALTSFRLLARGRGNEKEFHGFTYHLPHSGNDERVVWGTLALPYRVTADKLPPLLAADLPLMKWRILCDLFGYDPLRLLAACAAEAVPS